MGGKKSQRLRPRSTAFHAEQPLGSTCHALPDRAPPTMIHRLSGRRCGPKREKNKKMISLKLLSMQSYFLSIYLFISKTFSYLPRVRDQKDRHQSSARGCTQRGAQAPPRRSDCRRGKAAAHRCLPRRIPGTHAGRRRGRRRGSGDHRSVLKEKIVINH